MPVYNANEVTPELIISYFLYGQSQTPDNLKSESLIRPTTDVVTISIDMPSYLTTAGRFAVISMSPLVQKFFSASTSLHATGVRQEFNVAQLSALIGGVSEFGFQQLNYGDNIDDRAERTFIYNSVGFNLADSTRFVIDADGTKHIVNSAIKAERDNYDFTSTSTAARIFNPAVQAWVDPSGHIEDGKAVGGLGRKVDILYVNQENVPLRYDYSRSDYDLDVSNTSNHFLSITNPMSDGSLIAGIERIADDLFGGTTRFLDDENRPILYGTNNGETVAAIQVDQRALVYEYLKNGVHIYGGAGDDNIRGAAFNDKLYGGDGIDVIQGFSGDDVLFGGSSDDNLFGGAGKDTLYGDDGNDVLLGERGDSVYYGDAGDDLFIIGRGAGRVVIKDAQSGDRLVIRASDVQSRLFTNQLEGLRDKNGKEIYNAKYSDWGIVIETGITGSSPGVIYQSIGQHVPVEVSGRSNESFWPDYIARMNGRNLELTFRDVGYKGAPDIVVVIENFKPGTLGLDNVPVKSILNYSYDRVDVPVSEATKTGADPITPPPIPNANKTGADVNGARNQSMTSASQSGEDHLIGSDDDDTLYGLGGSDLLEGEAGVDFLDGGAGDDSLVGGRGDDELFGGDGSDTYFYTSGDGSDIILEPKSADTNTLKLTNLNRSDVSLSFEMIVSTFDQKADLIVTIIATGDKIRIASQFTDLLYVSDTSVGLSAIEFADGSVLDRAGMKNAVGFVAPIANVVGTEAADTLSGDYGNNFIKGLGGNDIISGGNGNDTIYGGTGADVLNGGAGDDNFVAEAGDGNDVINGGDGGGDTIDYGRVTSSIVVDLQAGTATGIDIGSDTIAGIENVQAGYSGGDDVLTGNAAKNNISAGDGNDTITGGLGDDTLSGGSGADTYHFARGDGDDRISDEPASYFGTAYLSDQDVVEFGPGVALSDVTFEGQGATNVKAVIANGGGSIYIGSQLRPGYGIEQFRFANGTSVTAAGVAAIVVTGQSSSGDDLINATGFSDTITAGAGNDRIRFVGTGDVIVYSAWDGNDTVESDSPVTLKLTNLNAADIKIGQTGNNLSVLINANGQSISVIDHFSSSSQPRGLEKIQFADGSMWNLATINSNAWTFGTGGDDILAGTSSNDRIDGRDGADQISGGGSDDILMGSAGNDILDGGVGADQQFGGDGDDIITTDGVDTTLSGGDGRDTLIYNGAGNIQYSLASSDFEVFKSGAGNDAIYGTNGNDELWLGAGNDLGQGYAGNDIIKGEEGDDILMGFEGNDTLDGGDGADRLFGGDGDDIVMIDSADTEFSGGNGRDTLIYTSSSDIQYALGSNDFEIFKSGGGNDAVYGTGGNDELWLGAGNDLGQGYAGNDTIEGEDGNDVLMGFEGADTLDGGRGNDTLIGGSESDTFVFRSGFGQDAIMDFVTGQDVLEFHDGIFANTAAAFAAATASGNDTIITIDASTSVLLQNVALANLHVDDFRVS